MRHDVAKLERGVYGFFYRGGQCFGGYCPCVILPGFSRRMEGNVSGEGKGSGYPADADQMPVAADPGGAGKLQAGTERDGITK